MNSYVTLQPVERWHLYSNYVNGKDTAGFLNYVNMFTIIGLLVLIIACINFINLTTARSEKRAKKLVLEKRSVHNEKILLFNFFQNLFCLLLLHLFFHCCLYNWHCLLLMHLPKQHIRFLFLMDISGD